MSEALEKRLARDVIAEKSPDSLYIWGLTGAASSQYLTQSRSR